MNKTFGQLLDEYIAGQVNPSQSITSAYLYMEDYQTPKMVLQLEESSWDYTDALFQAVDLHEQITEAKVYIEKLQAKIRELEKSKKEVTKAITLIASSTAPTKAKGE